MAAVEETLDSCHALMSHGIDRYHQPQPLSAEEEQNRVREREEYNWKRFDDIWRTVPQKRRGERKNSEPRFPVEPQENLLYFIEKHSPKLEPWQRELVRITRKMADQGDERGLGHVLALHPAQPHVRQGAGGFRLHARNVAIAHQRGHAARL
jgi:spore cortex formation protein SpoVR/YcgB (stage V sporulation)